MYLRANSHLIKNGDESKSKLVDAWEDPSKVLRANFLIVEIVGLVWFGLVWFGLVWLRLWVDKVRLDHILGVDKVH